MGTLLSVITLLVIMVEGSMPFPIATYVNIGGITTFIGNSSTYGGGVYVESSSSVDIS